MDDTESCGKIATVGDFSGGHILPTTRMGKESLREQILTHFFESQVCRPFDSWPVLGGQTRGVVFGRGGTNLATRIPSWYD
jgi:hypothetical protein